MVRPSRRSLVVFAICLVPRASAVFFWPAHTTYYWELADSLARGRGFTLDDHPITFMEPLYPAFLAVLKLATNDSAVASALLQAALAAAGGVLLWRYCERLANSRVALIATLFYAFYPYYVRQAGAWIEVSFATTLLIAAVWQYTRIENIRGAAVCGVWLGLLVLTRATFLVSVAGLFAMLVVDRHLTRALAMLVVTVGLVMPWAVRSWVIDGSLLPSRVGENLYVSTNRLSRAVGPRYDIDLLVPYAYEDIADEVATSSAGNPNAEVADRILRDRAVRFAAAHPLEVAWLKGRNFLYLFDPRLLPGYEKAVATRLTVEGSSVRFENLQSRPWIDEVAHATAQSSLLVLASVGVWLRRRRWHDDQGLLIVAASFAVTYTVFFPTTRLIAPAMFIPMFYAGVACARLLARPMHSIAGAPRQR